MSCWEGVLMPRMVARPLANEWMQGESEEEVRKGGLGGGVPNGHGLGGFPTNSTPVNGVDSCASNCEGEGCREGCQPATAGGCLVREA